MIVQRQPRADFTAAAGQSHTKRGRDAAHRLIVSRVFEAKLARAGTFRLSERLFSEREADSAAPDSWVHRNAELADTPLDRHMRHTDQFAALGVSSQHIVAFEVDLPDVSPNAFSAAYAAKARAPIVSAQRRKVI